MIGIDGLVGDDGEGLVEFGDFQAVGGIHPERPNHHKN
jgi:hypothetical protein